MIPKHRNNTFLREMNIKKKQDNIKAHQVCLTQNAGPCSIIL